MTSLKTSDIARRLRDPAALPGLVLVHGSDSGAIREQAAAIVEAASAGSDDPFALVRLDGAEVASDPGRLSDEARTVALFGGRRTIWVRDGGGKNLLPAVEPLLESPPEGAVVVIEAGDLKKGTGLRKRVEDDRAAAAIACYPDAARDLDRVIDEEAGAFSLGVAQDARAVLHALLGGDRAATRSEVQKLMLYARGDATVTLDHVRAVVSDVSANTIGDIVDAAFLGRLDELDRGLERLAAVSTHPSVLAGAALRWAQSLAEARLEVEAGMAAGRVVERMTPPVFFARKPLVTQMLEGWTSARLLAAARALDDAVYRSRRQAALADAIVADVLFRIARAAAAGIRSGAGMSRRG